MTQHTPTPWKWMVDPFTQRRHIESADGLPVAVVASEMDLIDPEAMYDDDPTLFERQKGDARNTIDANAEHIVRCVNTHDDLLAACKSLLLIAARQIQGTTDGQPVLERARAAIAKAEGEQP